MKPKISIAILSLLLTITVSNSYASTIVDRRPLKERVASMTENEKKVRLEEIKARVEYIKEMDKSELSRSERKALKKELKDMNKEARTMSGGVYLSVGAIIIIILLLILIL
jgi:GMP synthase PP-ATPase subunit